MFPTNDQLSVFAALLRQNPQSARFYNSFSPAQRRAIMEQLPQMTSRAQLQGFVDNLPSAAL